MAKVMYSATMSLDGFIAGPCGDASWMTEFMGPNPGQAVQRGLGRAAVRAHHRAPDTRCRGSRSSATSPAA
jgi:hypothetical protein